jgi:hypothetical protein
MINPTLFAALCGFLFRELLAIEGREDKDRPFNLLYYAKKNWLVLALNTVGTVGLYLALPEIMRLEAAYWGGEYPILTGFAVGLLGAWLVRKFQDVVKSKASKTLDNEGA